MKKKISLLAVLSLVVLATMLASCANRLDGDWDPMKWRTEALVGKGGKVRVPPQGGTYTFTCTNYSSIWLADIMEDGVLINKPNEFQHLMGAWSDSKTEKNLLTVTIQPNATGKQRVLEVSPTAGDIFARFVFEQQ